MCLWQVRVEQVGGLLGDAQGATWQQQGGRLPPTDDDDKDDKDKGLTRMTRTKGDKDDKDKG